METFRHALGGSLLVLLLPAACAPAPGAAPDAATRARAAAVPRDVEPMDRPGEAAEFFAAQRLADGAPYPTDHMAAVLETIRARQDALRAADAPPAGGVSAPWTELGPGNIGGRTRAIVIDPDDPGVMFAAGVSGGVWKSTDAGGSWRSLDDFLENIAVSTIAMDPADSSVLYAGTGEGFAPVQIDSYARGLGIYKSTDAGESWALLEGTRQGVPFGAFHYVNKVVVSPNDSNRVYAATRYGIWRSLDAGATWSVRLANPRYLAGPEESNGSGAGALDLAVRNDRDPDVLFAAFGSFESDGLFRSDDGGETWVAYGMPINQGRMTLRFAPSDQDVLYLLMADNGIGGPRGQLVQLFRSPDGGQSFDARVDLDGRMAPWLLSNLLLSNGCLPGGGYAQGWHDSALGVDPVDPDVVWVGGVDIFRSDDGGRTWGVAGYWYDYLEDPPSDRYIHPDHHTIVFHPDYDGAANQTMYVGNDGGLFRTMNARAATSQEDCPFPPDEKLPDIVWETLNHSYGVTQFYHGDSAQDRDMFVGGAQDNGTDRGLARDDPNGWRLVFGGDGGYVAIDPTNGDTLYVEYQGFPTIQKSVDGGETFVPATNGITDSDGIFITPFTMDPSRSEVLWTGGRRPWRTTNAAASWEPAGGTFPGRISAIAVAPSESDVVYIGLENGRVAHTRNALDPVPSWSVFSTGLPNGTWASSVAVDPEDPNVAFVTYSEFITAKTARTLDGGATWEILGSPQREGIPDIPAHWLAVRPCNPQQLFLGTELGVFVSEDRGGSWEPAIGGIPNVIVETLDFRSDHELVAFTHGRGAFMTTLLPCPGCPADLNGDGVVAFDDLLALLAAWGPCEVEHGCAADVDRDGLIGFDDLLALLAAWGAC